MIRFTIVQDDTPFSQMMIPASKESFFYTLRLLSLFFTTAALLRDLKGQHGWCHRKL